MLVGLLLWLATSWSHLGDGPLYWQPCPYGQQLLEHQCVGEAMLMDRHSARQFAAQQAAVEQLPWRLPTAAELKAYPRERFSDLNQQLISAEHIAHGNEFMVITLNPRSGKLEYQPMHYRGLIVLIRD